MKKKIDQILASLRELQVNPLPPREHIMDLLSSSSGSARTRVLGTGGSRIPAILDLKLLPKEENLILKDTGMDRKLRRGKNDIEYILDPQLDDLNKYLTYKITHLKELLTKKQYKTYGRHCRGEMKHSLAFQLSAYNSVFKGGYKNRSGKQVIADIYAVRRILTGKPGRISFHRVYIPKGNISMEEGHRDGEKIPKRPLGVPSPAGRVVLRIGYNFIEMFVKEKLQTFNHAFMVGKGTKTAIEDLIEKVSKAKYVYEFDLKGFFDNVPIFGTVEILRKGGMPIETCLKLTSLLLSTPSNLLNLTKHIDFNKDTALQSLIARKFVTSLSSHPRGQGKRILKSCIEFLKDKEGCGIVATELSSSGDKAPKFVTSKIMGKKMLNLLSNPLDDYIDPYNDSLMYFRSLLQSYDGLEYSVDWNKKILEYSHKIDPKKQIYQKCPMGLPQGASISTILSITWLKEWEERLEKRGIKLMMYADDGFLYSNEPFRVSGPKAIKINKEKSGGIKKDGVILKEKIKFLGTELNLKSGILTGCTRSGKTLSENTQIASLRELLSKISVNYDKENPGTKFNLLGTYISKLYQGEWGPQKEGEDHEREEYKEDSLWGLVFTGRGLLKSPKTKRAASALSMRILLETVKKSPKDSINMLKGVLAMTSDMDLRIFIALGSPFELYCKSMAKTIGLPGIEHLISDYGEEIEERMKG